MVIITATPQNNFGIAGFNTLESSINDLFGYNAIYHNTNGYAVAFRKKMVELQGMGRTQREIADALNCSNSVVKKWLRRYREGDHLEDQSRAPLHREIKNTEYARKLVKEIKEKFPFYGSRRISHEIEKEFGIVVSHMTVSQMMKEIAPQKATVIPQRI